MSARARLRLGFAAWAVLAILLECAGCGGPARALVVRTDPAESQICIKGRADSDFFTVEKNCVGTTPFDADRVIVTDAKGRKRTVKFKDVESAGEYFYVILEKPGFHSQALLVPDWNHMVVLKSLSEKKVEAVDTLQGLAPPK